MTMKTVFMSTQPMEAELVRALLSEHGIVSFLENEFGNQLGLGMQAPMIPLLVNVDEAHEAEALKIVSTRPKATRTPSTALSPYIVMACASCGKKLETLEGEEAPEECPWCGKSPISKP